MRIVVTGKLLFIGIIFLILNLYGFLKYIKPDIQKEQEARENNETLEELIGEEATFNSTLISAIFFCILYTGFYFLGFIIFTSIAMEILSIIMIALTLINFIFAIRMAKTKNFKVNLIDKISQPMDLAFIILFLYHCFKKINI